MLNYYFEKIAKINRILGISYQLAKINFKLRNEGSYMGILWYLIEPVVSLFILMMVGGLVGQSDIPYYPVYLFIGLIMFNLFVNTTNSSAQAIVDNGSILKSIKINPEIFVISWIIQYIFSHAFEFLLLIVVGLFFGLNVWWFVFYPLVILFFSLFTTGVSFIIATYSVYIVDLKNIWSIMTRLLWFVTPIFYSIPSSGWVHDVSMLNPMFHFINITRDILIYHNILEVKTLFLAIISSITVFLFGLYIFEKNKVKFAERL